MTDRFLPRRGRWASLRLRRTGRSTNRTYRSGRRRGCCHCQGDAGPKRRRAVRDLIDGSGLLSDAGRKTQERIESITDELAATAYTSLGPSERDKLITDLKPISAALNAAGSR